MPLFKNTLEFLIRDLSVERFENDKINRINIFSCEFLYSATGGGQT